MTGLPAAGAGLAGRRVAVIDAPSNLGLRPPEPGEIPGCDKAPGVLRDLGLLGRIGAEDAGVVTPGRYRPRWSAGEVRNEAAIADHARRLADRIAAVLSRGTLPLVLGGDCSILCGVGVALQRAGRYGLIALDGLDYRHPGRADDAGVAVGGESLAFVTGLGGGLAELDGARPYVAPSDIAVVGVRPGDEYAPEAAAAGIAVIDAAAVRDDPVAAAVAALDVAERSGIDGFWIHCDADVLDPTVMPAVDSPEPGGVEFDEIEAVLGRLLASPGVVGVDLCIYDPDLDPARSAGAALADLLEAVFRR